MPARRTSTPISATMQSSVPVSNVRAYDLDSYQQLGPTNLRFDFVTMNGNICITADYSSILTNLAIWKSPTSGGTQNASSISGLQNSSIRSDEKSCVLDVFHKDFQSLVDENEVGLSPLLKLCVMCATETDVAYVFDMDVEDAEFSRSVAQEQRHTLGVLDPCIQNAMGNSLHCHKS